MSSIKSGTKERIVEASVKLFAQQGFSATTTREIAHLADVNECTVFRYFPTKYDLFWTAVRSRLEHLSLGKELDIALAKDEDPKKVVPRIVAFLVQTVTYHPELIRLIRFSLLEQQLAAIGRVKIGRRQMAAVGRRHERRTPGAGIVAAPSRSTLMTSAPRSARICPAQGPAKMRASSSTRSPASGPGWGLG